MIFGICAIEAECSLFNSKWCSTITSSWSVGTYCLYPVTMWKMQRRIGLLSPTLHFKLQQYLVCFEDTVVGLHRAMSTLIFLTHAVIALISCITPMAGIHSAHNTTVVWLITCCKAMNVATLWHIAELCATTSVQLLRYLTKSSAFTCSDSLWEKWPGRVSSCFLKIYWSKFTEKSHPEETHWWKTDSHSWSSSCI